METGLAVLLLTVLAGYTVAAVRRTLAARPTGLALAACHRHPLPTTGSALVLPTDEPLAYVAGILRPEVVVSAGLLHRLSTEERHAVLAHEAAHLRLGHAPLLTLASALARTYRWLPGMTRAWTLLRRELEAAADDAAARSVGTAALLSALARVTLARTPAPAFNDLDAATLRYRIDRLRHPGRVTPAGRSPATLCGLTLAAALSWSGCALAGRPSAVGFLACATGAGWLASRPAGGARALRRRRAGHTPGR